MALSFSWYCLSVPVAWMTFFLIGGGVADADALPPATAVEQYPCKLEGDPKTAWYRILEMDPDYLVKFRLGNHTLAVPYAYGTGRLTPEEINCTPVRDEFHFAFWMPDLKPSVKDAFNFNSWPQEERTPPGGGYMVHIMRLADIPEGQESPTAFPFLNIRAVYDESWDRKLTFDGHLIAISTVHPTGQHYVNFERDQTLLICYPDSNCEFFAYFLDLRFGVWGSFPYEALPEWRAIIDGTRTLLQRWRVK